VLVYFLIKACGTNYYAEQLMGLQGGGLGNQRSRTEFMTNFGCLCVTEDAGLL
jgi:hypothetical protein